jgi:hypothetical protein
MSFKEIDEKFSISEKEKEKRLFIDNIITIDAMDAVDFDDALSV